MSCQPIRNWLDQAGHYLFIERQPVEGCDLTTTAAKKSCGRIVAVMCVHSPLASLESLTRSLAICSTPERKNVIFLSEPLSCCYGLTFQEVENGKSGSCH